MPKSKKPLLGDDSRRCRDAVILETRVRSFSDANGAGIRYFSGITALWILPFHPAPLRDDGDDMNNRPDWVFIPLTGIERILKDAKV